MKKTKSYFYDLFSMNGQPSCRLLLGSLGFLIFIITIVLTVIFGYNGKAEHVDLIKNLGYVSASLLGLSAVDLSHLRYNKNSDDDGKKSKE
jgi:hypothetical protein